MAMLGIRLMSFALEGLRLMFNCLEFEQTKNQGRGNAKLSQYLCLSLRCTVIRTPWMQFYFIIS
uniref:Uncharacterized protein n=1 Tax=Rhizophora mucronata TaxID=61149 RepID=A0A2P2IM96_RHIMU